MMEIGLEGIRIHAPIGVYPEEKIVGNDFLVDLAVRIEGSGGTINDLSRTVNYEQLFEIVTTELQSKQDLIETVAQRCIDKIKQQHILIKHIEIKIRKLNPPLEGEIAASYIRLVQDYE